MKEPLIPGGCILLARKIIESEIWEKPPLYLKVWVYLLTRAQHDGFKGLSRGELRTSIPEIIEACKWRVGARVERPTKDQIFQILEWLRGAKKGRSESNAKATREQHEGNAGATMITTTKATHGIVIFIDNYGFYQDIKNYESNDEPDDENPAEPQREPHGTPSNPDNINKNYKNDNIKPKKTLSRQRKTYAEDSTPYKMAAYLHSKIMAHAEANGVAHLVREANLQAWADDCRKLLDLDKRNKEEAKQVIDWATQDPFWQSNILSADKLRKKYVELCVAMNRTRKGGASANRSSRLSKSEIQALENEMRGERSPQ